MKLLKIFGKKSRDSSVDSQNEKENREKVIENELQTIRPYKKKV